MIYQEVCSKGSDWVVDRLTIEFIVAKLQSGSKMTDEALVTSARNLAEMVVAITMKKRQTNE